MSSNFDDNAAFDELLKKSEDEQAQLNADEQAMLQAAIDSPKPVEWISPQASAAKTRNAIKRMRQVAFLKAFAECGTVTRACKAVGINSTTQREWHKEPWYADLYKDAYKQYLDRIEQEVHDRAIVGEQVPIIGKVQTPHGPEDRIIGHKTVKSDLLLMFHAKRHIPEYRDKYEKQEDNSMEGSNNPMARISMRLDMIAARQQQSLPPQEVTIIESEPVKQLPCVTEGEPTSNG